MRRTTLCVATIVAMCSVYALPALAQKGMGDATGIARQVFNEETEKPEIKTLRGKLLAVETGPCENTTGRALTGTHLLIEASEGEEPWNVHLGPAPVIEQIMDLLEEGEVVTVEGFRTEKMKERHYVAQTLKFGDDNEPIELRDETLRPVWAGGATRGGGQQWGRPAWGGRGQGRGGSAWGRGAPGRGGGRNAAARGQGRGGFGRGQGRGQGQGQGRVRGQGGFQRGPQRRGGYRQNMGW
ncbi:MAG: hypothetical protein R6U98_33515 [Pirellulaceae bacterium]